MKSLAMRMSWATTQCPAVCCLFWLLSEWLRIRYPRSLCRCSQDHKLSICIGGSEDEAWVDDRAGTAETGTRVVMALVVGVTFRTSGIPMMVRPAGFVVVTALAVPRILIVVPPTEFNLTEASKKISWPATVALNKDPTGDVETGT